MRKAVDDQYSEAETQRRFEAALRGARKVGHRPMKDIPKTRRTSKDTPHADTPTGGGHGARRRSK
jgi:hypothetical protein